MTSQKVSILLLLAVLLVSTGALPVISSIAPSTSAGLEFVPQAILAPGIVTRTAQGSFSCITPTPPSYFHCYTPDMVYSAYNLNSLYSQGINGKGETIVIVDSYGSPTALSDLQTFSSTFGLPVPNTPGGPSFSIYYPSGTPTYSNSAHGTQQGWAVETSLDLQWAHAIAPLANIVLVAANPEETQGVQGFPSIFKGEQWAVENYPGSVMSQSFSVTEQSFTGASAASQISKFDQVYQLAVTNRVTVLAATGDSGTANTIGGQGASSGKAVPYPTVTWPPSDPLVTAVGGTWLQYGWTWNPSSPTDMSFITTPGSRTEAVWNEPFLPAAGGGGQSVVFPTPSFQSGISTSVLGGARGVPDISWNAAVDGGVLVYLGFLGSSSGFYIIGGTSAATPQTAGVIALTNQVADMSNKQHVGWLNPALYTLPSAAFGDIVPQTFNSITIGDNSLYGSGIPGYPATVGYDLATGFGSPNGETFVNDLVSALP
ncbi:MAG TPA: S53 family peptidase [Nitrososphaerales archaeon]|nr:S53 family peptidase [Nitrososphaerales archaeon]